MYYVFPANSTFPSFVQKIKHQPHEYVFVLFTFLWSYASLVSKQRYLQERLHEHIPLFVVDIRESAHVYHQMQQLFPDVFLYEKVPVHICLKKSHEEHTNRLQLQPILRNNTVLGDRHFAQLRTLVSQETQKDELVKEERVAIS